jgi:hypothetical protein
MVHEQIDMPTPNKYLRGNLIPIHARILPIAIQALLAPKPTLVNKHNLMNDNNVTNVDNQKNMQFQQVHCKSKMHPHHLEMLPFKI